VGDGMKRQTQDQDLEGGVINSAKATILVKQREWKMVTKIPERSTGCKCSKEGCKKNTFL
jgi:hypothetical protein